MRLFTDYTKPGKGIDPNEKPKPAFIRYWIILWRKRYKLSGTNLMYLLFAFISPVIAALCFLAAFAFYASMSGTTVAALLESERNSDIFLWTMTFAAIFLTSLPVFTVGPAAAGSAFLFKSFANEQPVFLWSDYRDKMKTNLKLSLKVMITNALAAFIIMIDMAAYRAILDNRTGAFPQMPMFISLIVQLIILFAFIMLLMISLYVYPMMVTFKVTYKQLYKNAMILSIARWLPNLGMLLLEAVLIFAPIVLIPGIFQYIVPLVLYVFITPAFIGYTNTFYIWSTIKKYLLDNPNADKSEKPEETHEAPAEEEKTSGHFENGRWVE